MSTDPAVVKDLETNAQHAEVVEQIALNLADTFTPQGIMPGAIFLGMLVAASEIFGSQWTGTPEAMKAAYDSAVALAWERAVEVHTIVQANVAQS